MSSNSISKMESVHVGYSGKWIEMDLYPPFGDIVESDKGVVDVAALLDFFGWCVDIDKLIEQNLSIDEGCTVDDDQLTFICEDLINIVAV